MTVAIRSKQSGVRMSENSALSAVDELDLAAHRISFQSANAWDASGAAAFGFRVAWINRFGQPGEVLPGEPQAELGSLTELPALLGL